MSEWRKKQLQEIAFLKPTENLKKGDIAPNIPMANIKEFQRDVVKIDYGEFRGGTKFRNGDTLLAKITPCLENGKTAFVNCLQEDEIGFGSTEFIVLRAKESIDERFLYYLSISPEFRKQAISLMEGTSGRKRVNENALKISDFLIPDLEEQRKIANILSAIDDKIQINNQINQELEAMAKTLYDYWFVQFDFPDQNGKPYKSSGGKMVYNPELKREIPEGWGVEKLKDKLSVSRGISYKTENIKDNIGIPMINLASIGISRNYKSSGLKFFNGEYSKEKIVSGGDLLIACTDLTRNADIVGSPIIVPFDEQKYLFSMDLAKIDSKVDYINKYYLYSTLRTEHYHNYIKKWASGTNVLHLNIDGMGWYSIAIPPMNLQEEYSKIILNFSKKTNNNIQQNQELTQLRDWLLPMLMNGQVKVE